MKYTLHYLIGALEMREGRFYTLHWRPKTASKVSRLPLEKISEDTIAIVMQGPLSLKDDFTYNTCLLYRKLFPNSVFVLSTWVNQDPETLKKIEDCGWSVVLSEPPQNKGYANINLMIKSTFAGISMIKNYHKHVGYVVKTRTDQRMYNQSSLQFFMGLWKSFPSSDLKKQKGRLIVPVDTPTLRLYGVGDMLMFGHVDDMATYWNVPHDTRNAEDLASLVSKENTIESFAKLQLSEIYLTTNYLKKIGRDLTWELADSWNAISEYFIITEPALVDLFWQKNSLYQEFKHRYYTVSHTWEMMTFADWLMLYQHNYDKSSVPKVEEIFEGATIESPKTPYIQSRMT